MWEERQFSPNFQFNIKKFQGKINGTPVTTDHYLDGEASDTYKEGKKEESKFCPNMLKEALSELMTLLQENSFSV